MRTSTDRGHVTETETSSEQIRGQLATQSVHNWSLSDQVRKPVAGFKTQPTLYPPRALEVGMGPRAIPVSE